MIWSLIFQEHPWQCQYAILTSSLNIEESVTVKRNLVTLIGVVVIIAGIVAVRTAFQQTIQTEAEIAAAAETEKQLKEAKEITGDAKIEEASANIAEAATTEKATPAPTNLEGYEEIPWVDAAPETYRVKFDTTAGPFVLQIESKWSEEGAKRFFELCKMGFFDNSGFFRVVKGFVVQFGLAADPKMTAQYNNKNLRDEPVRKSNQKGMITFATGGPNTRTTQVFINFGDNARLDQMGFTPFGEVVYGMENVEKITDEYGEQPDQTMIKREGSAYLKRDYPNLDFITRVSLVK